MSHTMLRSLRVPTALLNPSKPFMRVPMVASPSRSFASVKHKKLIKMAKGYRNRAKNVYSVALQRVTKALQYAYRDRRTRPREYRKDWILRISAAVHQHGLNYSRFIQGMTRTDVRLNRKVLADMSVTEPLSFKAVVDTVKSTRVA
mmetsp:Transcript_73863/g.148871  ORF Transcript_73863/g.148871 Transcript_73863/m.148871 type:complete len:146 (-) Transcript_73863:543-980(-)